MKGEIDMSKTKSRFVTALMAVMLGVILAGLWKLGFGAFWYIAGALAGYGYIQSARLFCRWLGHEKKQAVLPPAVKKGPHNSETPRAASPTGPDEDAKIWKPDAAWTGDYDAIKAEVKGEAV